VRHQVLPASGNPVLSRMWKMREDDPTDQMAGPRVMQLWRVAAVVAQAELRMTDTERLRYR